MNEFWFRLKDHRYIHSYHILYFNLLSLDNFFYFVMSNVNDTLDLLILSNIFNSAIPLFRIKSQKFKMRAPNFVTIS